jgi:autotransporter-associated beta strand protein
MVISMRFMVRLLTEHCTPARIYFSRVQPIPGGMLGKPLSLWMNSRLRNLGMAVLMVLCASPVLAAYKYWVGISGNTNAPTGGTWQTSTPVVWSDGSTATANSVWNDGDTALFGGADGTYGIKVGGAINAASLQFSASGYTLTNDTPQTITGSTSPFLIVGSGKTNIIGSNVTVSVGFAATATLGAPGGSPGGTLLIENGGVVQETTTRPLNISGAGTLVSVKTGGVLKNASSSAGTPVITVGATVGDNVTLSVDGGTVSIARSTASLWIPTGPTAAPGDIQGTVNLNGGAITTTGGFVELANGLANLGTFNLNGGVLTLSQVFGGAGTSIFNFNGGVLQALSSQSSFMTGLTTINVRNGGAVIDSGGNYITIGQSLLHSTIPGDDMIDGGLTKLDVGTLMLAGTNTYTGATIVSEGTLAVGGSIQGPVVVSAAGTLSGGPFIGPISISNNLTLNGTLVMRVDKTSGITNDTINGVTALNYGGTLELDVSGGTLAAGDVLNLFDASSYNGGFAKIVTVPALISNLTFDTNGLLTNGSLRVITNSVSPPDLEYANTPTGLQLSWNTTPLYQYQLITTTNLANNLTNWSNYGPCILGNGGTLSEIIPTTNVPQQFFSFVANPLPIDPSRLPAQLWKNTQWVDPGGWTTINVTNQGLPANDTNIDAAVQIASIINSTSGRRRLYFPAGTYSFKSSLAINGKSDLWFDGDGRSNTVFRIDAPGSANAEIGFYGSSSGNPVNVLGSQEAGDITVTVADASTFNVGDLVQLYATNAPLVQGGLSFVTHVYGQMFKIAAINGNTLTMDMKVLLNYPSSYAPVVQRYNQIQNIKVSHLLISRVNEPTNQDVSNLEFYDAYNCYVVQMESNFSQRHHIYFQNSKDCVIESNYVHDCFVHTTGGYGYGYGLVGSTGCRISDNKSTRLRHHIILQLGANYNVVSYNSIEVCYDYNDMALHAGYAYMNLFEGDMCQQSYADTSKDGASNVEPSTGPENTWFRNYITQQVGCIQSATSLQNVIGDDAGSISTNGSNHYVGANDVASSQFTFGSPWPGGTVNWGVFPTNVALPASLYLTNSPIFFNNNTPWPVFGPGVANWGVTNAIPARTSIPTDP